MIKGGSDTLNLINDISLMDEIFNEEIKYSKKYGIEIKNISHWDSSNAFKSHMSQSLVIPEQSLPWDYYYTYSISEKDRQTVIKKLGVNTSIDSIMCLLLQSSTIAIVNMINFLVHHNKKKLCILQPSYFSVSSCCEMFSLNYSYEQIEFTDNNPIIPVDKIISGGYDCLWITSPVYCTSYYFDKEQYEQIHFLRKEGLTIVFDESLSLPGKELLRTFSVDENTFAIYSPHKSLSINGLKFSVIVCHRNNEEFLEQWVDIFSGALSSSNRDAILHYISSNYIQECYPAYKLYIEKTKSIVYEIANRHSTVYTLPNTSGHYISIFTGLKLNSNYEIFCAVSEIIKNCYTSIIPGSLNGFDDSKGLSFRVNLTGDIHNITNSLERILYYIENHY